MTTPMTTLWIKLHGALPRRDEGASLVEYALLAALIAIVCLTAVFFLGTETSESFNSTAESVRDAT